MKFRKTSKAREPSPKMELLRRSNNNNHNKSSFKRSKSFRASVKLISKIRNHAPSYDFASVSLNPRGLNNNEENSNSPKIKQLSRVPESLIEKDDDEDEDESRCIVRALETKLKIGCTSGGSNAYENPTFMNSSLDSSGCFYRDDELSPKKLIDTTPKKEDYNKKKEDNGLTVIIESSNDNNSITTCGSHRWCTRITSTASPIGKSSVFYVDNEENNNKNNKKKSTLALKPRTVDNIANLWSSSSSGAGTGTRVASGSFRAKGKSTSSSAKRKELEERTSSKQQQQKQQKKKSSFSYSSTKLHALQGMEFLESFGKKKQLIQQQQQQQTTRHPNQQLQLANLAASSIHPLAAHNSLNIHVHALFAAVEHGHIDKARAILESTDVDVNSVNSDCLSPLDVAVLSNNRALAKMLVAFGAQEGNKFKSPETLGSHLSALLSEAEHRAQELGGNGSLAGSSSISTSSAGSSSLLEPPGSSGSSSSVPSHRGSFSTQHNNLTGCGGSSAEDKQLALWERRSRALRKMLLGFDQARPPDVPFVVTIDVTGTTSVSARFQESEVQESPICTKFKIQWSLKEDFGLVCGERELLDMKQKECRIEGLMQGHKYYFRAAAGNLKGYSRFRPTTPGYLTPSSWRDIDGRLARFAGRLEQLDSLFTDVRGPDYNLETPGLQRRNHKKKTTIKQLFTATSKFQKNLRRGVFLSCLLYHEDKVLVTNEDFLPCIEVDETYPSCIYNDFHWLMKVACTWDDVKSLRQDMEKCQSSSSNHFRIKLLQAATQMQAALCIQDLGQLYHKPIRDVQGTLVFSSVNYVRSPKLVSVLNSRWLPLAKVTKKIITHEDSNVADILMASIQDQMTYHQVSGIKLSRGLYLGYLKMQSSVDSIQVVVPAKSPNVLPHCKIRDNPHVSAEEWDYLKRMARLQALTSGEGEENDDVDSDANKENTSASNIISAELQGTEQQKLFIDVVAATARRLFSHMEISPDDSLTHRLYDAEVIELTPEVSFLVAVPPPETACSVPGTREILLQRGDLLSLPIQVFEMVHLGTYQKDVINRYSRLSCILELDTAQAQHNHREAFSTTELTVAKDKLTRLQDLQSQMNTVWKGARWLIDVITFARDRGTGVQSSTGISIKHLLSLDRNKNTGSSSGGNSSNGLKRSLLQIPPRDPKLVKASPGRGSWPGPSVTNSNGCSQTNLLSSEFSKSEQQLPRGPPYYPRKGSNCSNCSSASEPYKSLSSQAIPGGSGGNLYPTSSTSMTKLPPSRSEDTLLMGKYKHQSPRGRPGHGVVPPSSASASTSPLLGVKFMGPPSSVNSTSESCHSISSDEYPSGAVRARPATKLTKPTASVAAIADKQMLADDKEDIAAFSTPLPGILQVYAAYETGLASGTSLKLHVTGRTTAREVVDLVVKQLNMAVLLKGLEGPVYAQEELSNFCLVAVIGARERCLRDDFKPLQLQNPWKKGRLYVRQKHDVLAALEHSSKHTAYL